MNRRTLAALGIAACVLLIGSATALPAALSVLVPRFGLRPTPLTPIEANPARWGLPRGREIRFRAADGVSLHGWWVPAERSPGLSACGTVLLFHGRSANIATRASAAVWLASLGYNALLFDYRGYGASEQIRPDETGLFLDGRAAYRYATERAGVPPGRLVLLGQSMGTAVASRVAAEQPAAGLVLVSPAINAPGMVRAWLRAALPWAPVGWLDWERNRFEVATTAARSGEPLVVAASRADRLAPIDENRTVYNAAPDPKRWIEVKNLPHNGLLQSRAMQEQLAPALRELLPCP